jgi:hypothetical protein
MSAHRERRAFVCPNKACVPPRREFLDPDAPMMVPECENHGKMVRQPNNEYVPGRFVVGAKVAG